jgi:adenine-specific DNA-methyltransferase
MIHQIQEVSGRALIAFQKTTGSTSTTLPTTHDYIIFFAKNISTLKYRKFYEKTRFGESGAKEYKRVEDVFGEIRPISHFMVDGILRLPEGARVLTTDSIVSKDGNDPDIEVWSKGQKYVLSCKPNRHWKTQADGIKRLWKINRLLHQSGLRIYKRYLDDFPYRELSHVWNDTRGDDDPSYVVQTHPKVVERCILMSTDPGDLVLDPTCGSGTTATVAEQWGRRWITIDTSRVSLALARSRLMGARYPYYLLADSPEGQRKAGEVTRSAPKTTPTTGRLRHGFVYERAPHITLKSIANNAEIDVIWEQAQTVLEPLRATLNTALTKTWQEWEIPREAGKDWPAEAKKAHAAWWQARIARQKEIDASIAARADVEYLYDKPYEDKSRIRVAGPFTVESLSPHRTLAVDWDDELIDPNKPKKGMAEGQERLPQDFAGMILENLRSAGVQQARKEDRISFSSLKGWPGNFICAEGRFMEGEHERRAGILIGPEFGTLTRPDLVAAAREAGDAGFDILIACAFAYDAHSAEFDKLGRLPVLKARMNPDLHMAKDLKATGHGNLFVVFGEPDIQIEKLPDGMLRVAIKGVDVFKPQTGEVVSEGRDGIALWMLDTDYNEESFFVRHAYFLGANDPYKALKTTLKAEIDEEAWGTLNSDVSRPFAKPVSGRIAVKVINHLGDEVMKVFAVG